MSLVSKNWGLTLLQCLQNTCNNICTVSSISMTEPWDIGLPHYSSYLCLFFIYDSLSPLPLFVSVRVITCWAIWQWRRLWPTQLSWPCGNTRPKLSRRRWLLKASSALSTPLVFFSLNLAFHPAGKKTKTQEMCKQRRILVGTEWITWDESMLQTLRQNYRQSHFAI